MIISGANKFKPGIYSSGIRIKKNPEYNNQNNINNYKLPKVIPAFNIYSFIPNIHFKGNKPTFDETGIKKLDIPNIHITNQNGVRGESLSHKRNRKFIPLMKQLGINQIIDLKTSDYSKDFKYLAQKNGLSYIHFPMDSENLTDREIIDKLPEFFQAINKGSFYIACAQGLHRTDIALSINYFFNKDANQEPPILYGHQLENNVRYNDIFRRTNSIFKSLTDEDRKKLGLELLDEKTYKEKKSKLIDANNQYNKLHSEN